MGAPRVSVVVPIFNAERFLRECLDSLAAQTLDDIEVVCVNDGSTDGSRAIIQDYLDRDPRFSVIDKPTGGYGDSLNRGVERAEGDWVAILEPDDWVEPDAYATMLRAGDSHDVAMVKADFFLHWTMGGYDRRYWWTNPGLVDVVWPECSRQVFFSSPTVWNALYRRRTLLEGDVRCLPTPGYAFQDLGFNFRALARSERVFLVNRALVHSRQDDADEPRASLAEVFAICDEYDGMLRWIDAHPELPDWLAPTTCRMRYDTYLWNYDRLAPELRPAFLERMRRDFRAEDDAGLADPLLFLPWAWRHRRLIEEEPEVFVPLHDLYLDGDNSKVDTLRAYYDRGGPRLVARGIGWAVADRLTS